MLFSLSLNYVKYFLLFVASTTIPFFHVYLFVNFTLSPFLKLFVISLLCFPVCSLGSLFCPYTTRAGRSTVSSSSLSVTFKSSLLTLSISSVYTSICRCNRVSWCKTLVLPTFTGMVYVGRDPLSPFLNTNMKYMCLKNDHFLCNPYITCISSTMRFLLDIVCVCYLKTD